MRNNPQKKIHSFSVRYIGCFFRCVRALLFHLSKGDVDFVSPGKMALFTPSKVPSEFSGDAPNANANAQFANVSRALFGMGGMLLAFIQPNPTWKAC